MLNHWENLTRFLNSRRAVGQQYCRAGAEKIDPSAQEQFIFRQFVVEKPLKPVFAYLSHMLAGSSRYV